MVYNYKVYPRAGMVREAQVAVTRARHIQRPDAQQ